MDLRELSVEIGSSGYISNNNLSSPSSGRDISGIERSRGGSFETRFSIGRATRPSAVTATWREAQVAMKSRFFLLVMLFAASCQAAPSPVSVDDLMRLRSISDVRISPDGKRVAYVVSTPSFETAAHEAVLYVVPSTGGVPLRLTHGTRIFNRPLPAPWLRWSPDGSLLSFVAFVDGVPQVMAMAATGGEPWAITSY